VQEAILALRIDSTFSKDKILELYLNEIFLGFNSYGVAAAALNYFDKALYQLDLSEMAYIAGLPKGPNNYHPFKHPQAAIDRRNYVLDQMLANGYVTQAEHDQATSEALDVTPRAAGTQLYSAEYFTEEVRRQLSTIYGEDQLYGGGLSVRTTLEPKLQEYARKALMDGLINYDHNHGFRGPVASIDITGDWGPAIAAIKPLSDVPEWELAVVLSTDGNSDQIGLRPDNDIEGKLLADRKTATMTAADSKWLGKKFGTLKPGDVVYVAPVDGKDGGYQIQQVPEIEGSLVAMDPRTGRVLAMVGGFSFDQSQFNRATQAYRQPGSSFKPIVYSSALDNGYTPSTVVVDAPIEIDQGQGAGVWRPENYSTGKYYGPQTLRNALQKSLNTVTVRLAQDIGMPLIGEYAKRFGVYDELPNYLSYALGAGETTVMRMVTAYSMFDNGGRRIKATLIDRIQDRYGRTIFKHDQRECRGCDAPGGWKNQPEPQLIDRREQVLDPMTAYQITSMMEGVVQHGTATVLRDVGKPIAGKTGTTNDEKDAWFIGFSPDLVVGIYIGYDKPRNLGRGATGGHLAAPIARDFFKLALADKPAVPFKVPAGIKLVRVDSKTGMRAGPGDSGRTILEAFKPGTAPPDNYSVIGVADADGRPLSVSPDADRAIIRSGTGGLY
jgi:penicillin-binding protein 1A